VAAFILPCIKELAGVNSWRIRYLVADRIREICRGLTEQNIKEIMLPHYVSFLKDAESEVRTAAVRRMSEFSQIIGNQEVIQMIIPTLKELQNDQFVYVRQALAENILAICPKIQKAATQEHILPIFLQLLRDDNSTVRLNLFNHLEDLNKIIGIQDL
jgi:serine/threonine-protein phosphatase 2A regulatory subunit A